jgi:adenine-specific DNA-methyltransferase
MQPTMITEPPVLLPLPEEERDGQHGAVFTQRWVVELMLDLAGYTTDKDLGGMVAVEPSCGEGAFLLPMVERLVQSALAHGRPLERLADAVIATDLLARSVEASREAVSSILAGAGMARRTANAQARRWIVRRDFLLDPPALESVDFVIGNPPYIRLEAVAPERSAEYRRACVTMGGRADVYVGFYEHGLHALREGGTLAFICADRWMRNAYGASLRAMVSTGWSVEFVLSMTGVDAFEEEVDAYPAITVLRRRRQDHGPLIVEAGADFGPRDTSDVVGMKARSDVEHAQGMNYRAARLPAWFEGRSGWPRGSPDRLALIADLEARLPPLEDPATGTRVGIGIATGADKVFVVKDAGIVEPERLLPLALPNDLASGRVEWSGRYLVNPWDRAGLVSLEDWPRMAAYLGQHELLLAGRHTARRGRWHKTIDRVIEGLADRPKLYLPDLKAAIFPVLDEGETYPHHNLYWVTSDVWDIRVLGGLLLSDVANLFIEAYSVRMRGGYLRFQAQYLRRIRLPRPDSVDTAHAQALVLAFEARDRDAATSVALDLYNLDSLPA